MYQNLCYNKNGDCMKKVIIIFISILVVVLLSIILVTHLGNTNNNYDTDKAKNVLYINYGVEKINDISVYFGENTYYISKIEKEKQNYISVLDNEYNLVLMIEKEKVKNPSDISNDNITLGYKYDKLVYEVKEQNKNGYNYIYYNAVDGELIKKIKMNR